MRGREPCLGEEIEKIRREKGMKQSDLCVNERYYRDIVAGKRTPPEDTLLKLLTDQTEGLGMTDVSIIERILKRYGFSAQEEPRSFVWSPVPLGGCDTGRRLRRLQPHLGP